MIILNLNKLITLLPELTTCGHFRIARRILTGALFLLIPLTNITGNPGFRSERVSRLAANGDAVKISRMLELLNARKSGNAAVLNVRLQVTFGDQDEENLPLSKTRFVLIDESFIKMLKRLKLDPGLEETDKTQTQTENIFTGQDNPADERPAENLYLEAAARLLRQTSAEPANIWSSGIDHIQPEDRQRHGAAAGETEADEEDFLIAYLINDEINRHLVAEVRFNAFVNGTTRVVKPGNYFLFGFSSTESELLVWHLPVTLTPGENILEVDQHNAELVVEL